MSFLWLLDGTPLLLRPIRTDDTARLETAWHRDQLRGYERSSG
jgi:hypothetical protein